MEQEQEVEGQTPSSEEQPPVTPAPVSEQNEEQLSQQDSQDIVLAKVEDLESQLRGLQSRQDKAESSFETRLTELGVRLTPDQERQNEVLNMRDEIAELRGQTLPVSAVVNDEEQGEVNLAEMPEVQQLIKTAVAEATKPPASGASAVAPSKGITTLSSGMTVESATAELNKFHDNPITKRTQKDNDRVQELMDFLEAEE